MSPRTKSIFCPRFSHSHALVHRHPHDSMQSLLRARVFADKTTGRLPTRQLHFFAAHRPGLKPQFFSAKRPQPHPATMDCYQILKRAFGNYGGQAHQSQIASTHRIVRTLIFMNISVFCMWSYSAAADNGKLFKYLRENTMLSWYNIKANRHWTLLTSAFSHQSFAHILFNMMGLHAFGSVLCMAGGVGVGPFHFAALFCGSAIAGSVAFLYQKKPQVDRRRGPYAQHGLASSPAALGASGAVMGLATAATCIAPLTPMSFLLAPGSAVPMFVMTGIYIGADLFLMGQGDLIAHSAHLGGALFGVVYYMTCLRRFGGISYMVRRWIGRR